MSGLVSHEKISCQISKWLSQPGAAPCLSLSAPNNFGKSRLLRLLVQNHSSASQPEPGHPLERQASPTLADPRVCLVYIDCNLSADDSPQAFYELVLRNLLIHLRLFNHSSASSHSTTRIKVLNQLYHEILTGTGFMWAQAFLVAIEEVMAYLEDTRLVLLFDEFDQPLAKLPSPIFRHMRALYDRFDTRLSYLIATRLPIMASPQLIQEKEKEEDFSEFLELFDQFPPLRLTGLSPLEAEELAKHTHNQFGLSNTDNLKTSELAYLYSLSGGHPVLTRLIARLLLLQDINESGEEESIAFWEDNDEDKIKQFELAVRSDPQIKAECQRIWQSLHPTEQTALGQWLEGVRSNQSSPLGTLLERGLINSQGMIFSRAFEWFVKSHFQFTQNNVALVKANQTLNGASTPSAPSSVLPSYTELAYDPRHQLVIFEGGARRVVLSGNAALLFDYLFRRQSLPYCTRDELISAVWGPDQAYSSENLDRLVSDLRQLLGDHDKQLIRTIHRRGLQMSPDIKLWNSTTHPELSSA